MIGRGDITSKPATEEYLSELFDGSVLRGDPAAAIKARFFPDDEVVINFTRRQSRIMLTITKNQKTFSIFEDYPTSYMSASQCAAAIIKALRDKVELIHNHLG